MSVRASFVVVALLGLFLSTSSFSEPLTDRFSPGLLRAYEAAMARAIRENNGYISEHHVAWALLEIEDHATIHMLKQAGLDPSTLKAALDDFIRHSPLASTGALPRPRTTLENLIHTRALGRMSLLRENTISGDNFLHSWSELQAFHTPTIDFNEETRKRLHEASLTYRNIPIPGDAKVNLPPHLGQFGIDLTTQARSNMFPSFGNDPSEINPARRNEILTILQSLQGNESIAILGDTGVGKTFLVQELARLSVQSELPLVRPLKGKRFISIDTDAIIAGSSLRGSAEERVKAILKEAAASKGTDSEIILVIENFDRAIGGNQSGDGATNIAGMISSEISKGTLPPIIVTANDSEWKKKVEKTAFAKQVDTHLLQPPDRHETEFILKGHKALLEIKYGIKISDGTLRTAIEMAGRYMGETADPKRSLELLDRSCRYYHQAQLREPRELEQLQEQLRKLRLEISWYNGTTEVARRAREKIESEITLKSQEIAKARAEFSMGHDLVRDLNEARQRLEEISIAVKLAQTDPSLASRLAEFTRDEKALLSEVARLSEAVAPYQEDFPNLRSSLDPSHMAMYLEEKKGITAVSTSEDYLKNLKNSENHLRQRVLGQEHALTSVGNALRRMGTGLKDPNRPIVFVFDGESGVGKTETAKALAELMNGSEDALIREEMETYSTSASVTKLIGSTRGYVGSDEGGNLTEKIRRRPYAVVLLDEFEQADEAVRQLFLKAWDEGFLEDASGLKIDCKNVIFVVTTNAQGELFDRVFPPKLLNRISERISFNKLEKEDLAEVAKMQVSPIIRRASENLGIDLTLDPDVYDYIAKKAEAGLGAREVKRILEREVSDLIATKFCNLEIHPGAIVRAVMKENGTIDVAVTDAPNCGSALEAVAE